MVSIITQSRTFSAKIKTNLCATLLLGAALFAAPSLNAQTIYQLPNAGFEQWDSDELTAEPTNWNSFATSDGPWASLASSPHHYHRHGSRPGGTGSHYLTIYTQSIIGIKANGNMTTGRIHAGGITPTSSDNYNYTERSNADHSLPFTATPDSMYVWVSFDAYHTGSEAQVEAILHGDNDFKAPNDVTDRSLYKGRAVVHTTRTTEYPDRMGWTLLKCPFNYNGTSTGNYMLVNMTTNNSPGAGEGDDSLSIDDITFIYSSWLTGLSVNGTPVADFDKGRLNYTVRLADTSLLMNSQIEASTEVSDATVSMTQERLSDTTASVLITVRAEDSVTVHQYSILLTAPTLPDPVSITDPDQAPRLQAYPNPVHDLLTVTAEGPVTLSDLAGRTLIQRECHGTTQFDLSRLATGTYLLRHDGTVQKIVKQ